jgi:uncharacterized membrane protein (DUF4010 family)
MVPGPSEIIKRFMMPYACVTDFSNPDFFYHVLIAVGVGALVGLEREHHKDQTSVLAGLRTFALVSLFGFIISWLSIEYSVMGWAILMGIPVIGGFALMVAYIKFEKGMPGMTTPMALMVTYFSGVLVGLDLLYEAGVLTVITTFLLVSRRRTHMFASILDDDELIGALQFLTIVVILYPITYYLNLEQPLDLLNRGGILGLNYILTLVVFVSGISFISFIVVRKEGAKRGLEFSGLLGGMVNSAATTASICNLVRNRKDLLRNAVSGIYLATGIMMVRNLLIIAVAEPELKTTMIIMPVILFTAAVTLVIGLSVKGNDGDATKIEMRSPFAIWPAIKFATLIVLLSIATYAATEYVGNQGVYVSAIAGLVSSAAVAASLGTLVTTGSVTPIVAAQTIMLASTLSCVGNLIITRTTNKDVEKALKNKMILITAVGLASTAVLFLV